MERSAMLFIGKPSISMGHLYHGYVTNNQRVATHFLARQHGDQKNHQLATGLPPQTIGIIMSGTTQVYANTCIYWLVVQYGAISPSWKMMEFVNGKDDITYMKWNKYNSCCKPPTSIGVYMNIPMHLWWSTCRDPGVQIPMFWSQICCEILASTLTKRQKVIFVIGKSSSKRSHCYVSWTTGIPLKTLHVALGTVLTTYKNGDDWWCKWHCFTHLISKKQLKSPCFTLQ